VGRGDAGVSKSSVGWEGISREVLLESLGREEVGEGRLALHVGVVASLGGEVETLRAGRRKNGRSRKVQEKNQTPLERRKVWYLRRRGNVVGSGARGVAGYVNAVK